VNALTVRNAAIQRANKGRYWHISQTRCTESVVELRLH